MAKQKFYTVTKEINGVEYTAQFNGISAGLQMIDECKVNGDVNNLELAKYVFQNVIVSPKVNADDFETMSDCMDVVKFGMNVAQGKFRNQIDGSTAKTTGKE